MNILDKIKRVFDEKPQIVNNPYYKIREDSFFLDDNYQQHYRRYGWVKIEQVVVQQEIDLFTQTFTDISKLAGFELNENLLNTGRLFNPDI